MTADHCELNWDFNYFITIGNASSTLAWARDDMDADEFADAAGCGCPGIGCGFDGGNVAANDGRYEPGTDLLIAHKLNVCGLYHGVGRLDHCDEAFAFDHS